MLASFKITICRSLKAFFLKKSFLPTGSHVDNGDVKSIATAMAAQMESYSRECLHIALRNREFYYSLEGKDGFYLNTPKLGKSLVSSHNFHFFGKDLKNDIISLYDDAANPDIYSDKISDHDRLMDPWVFYNRQCAILGRRALAVAQSIRKLYNIKVSHTEWEYLDRLSIEIDRIAGEEAAWQAHRDADL